MTSKPIEAGTSFDPRCVEALERILLREAVDDGLGTFPATDRRPELAHVGTR